MNRFPRGVRGKGADRRAASLAQLYKRSLQHLDSCYHHTAGDQTGPLVRRLQSFGKLEGLVVGPWDEGNKDLHNLVKTIADVKVAAKARALWREISNNELGIVVAQVRLLSVEQTGVPW